jgi:integrase
LNFKTLSKSKNPVEHLPSINASADIRRERRVITAEEFTRLVEAAHGGPDIQCVSGPDRAMLYVLAAWTGYRRGELASLTLKSFNFESDPPTVQVKAGYSKRRRNDIVPLHPVVAEQLKSWLKAKGQIGQGEPLFSLRTKSGGLRKTATMMKLDLERARAAWIEEAESDQERKRREESDYLQYQDENGLYADFHANRHMFITNLAKVGVHPKLAQSIARHSDVSLTMNVYSHVEVQEQATAINTLPAPPRLTGASVESGNEVGQAESKQIDDTNGVADISPRDLEKESECVAPLVAQTFDFDCFCPAFFDVDCQSGQSADSEQIPSLSPSGSEQKPLPQKELVILCQALSLDDAGEEIKRRRPDSNRGWRICNPLP